MPIIATLIYLFLKGLTIEVEEKIQYQYDFSLMTKELKKRSLFGLLTAQFIGAFNDNAWKLIVFTIATRAILSQHEGNEGELHRASQIIATLSLVIFLIPMLIFSFPAGYVANQYSKRTTILAMKSLGALLMGLATLSLFFMPQNYILAYFILGLMGVQSAIFSPAKYGILPEILPPEQLTKGNGLIEMWTMIAIIAGTGLGPVLLFPDHAGLKPEWTWLAPLALTILGAFGVLASFWIPKVPAASEEARGVSAEMAKAFKAAFRDKTLMIALLGNSFYWVITCLIGQNVLVYAKSLIIELEKGEIWQGIPPAAYGIGIAGGALLAAKLSGDLIEYGLIPLGAIGFAAMSLFLGFMQPAMLGTVITLIFTGVAAGLIIVPLHAIVQARSPAAYRGGILAIGNILDISGMLLGSSLAAIMALNGLELRIILILSALLVVLAMVLALKILHKNLLRLAWAIITNFLYKAHLIGGHAPQATQAE